MGAGVGRYFLHPFSEGAPAAGLKNQAADLTAQLSVGLRSSCVTRWGTVGICLEKGCGKGEGSQKNARRELQRAPGGGSSSTLALRS